MILDIPDTMTIDFANPKHTCGGWDHYKGLSEADRYRTPSPPPGEASLSPRALDDTDAGEGPVGGDSKVQWEQELLLPKPKEVLIPVAEQVKERHDKLQAARAQWEADATAAAGRARGYDEARKRRQERLARGRWRQQQSASPIAAPATLPARGGGSLSGGGTIYAATRIANTGDFKGVRGKKKKRSKRKRGKWRKQSKRKKEI